MDYPVLNKAPNTAEAVVPHSLDANGNAVPSSDANPMPTRPGTSVGVLTEVKIDTASSGDLALASATAAQSTKLYKLVLVAAAATTITFKDGSTTLTGAITLAAGGSIVLDFDGTPWFTGSANTAFNVNNSAAVQISGRAYYVKS